MNPERNKKEYIFLFLWHLGNAFGFLLSERKCSAKYQEIGA